jgi:hypothetical protein
MIMKYNGNPNPRNSNYLELFKRGTSFLAICFKQHRQYTML